MKAFVVSLLAGALALPTTATSLSGQIRVEIDGKRRAHNPERVYEQRGRDDDRYDRSGRGDRFDRGDRYQRPGRRARDVIVYEDGYRPRGGRVTVNYGRRHYPWRFNRGIGYAFDRHRPVHWTRVHWRNVRIRDHYPQGRRDFRRGAYVPDLYGFLGRRTYRRLERHAERIHAYGALNGRWIRHGRGLRVLQIRAGHVPLAEFIDFDRDRYFEEVWLNTPYR